MKAIAVYCGAAMGNEAIYENATIKLAKWLVKNDYALVYGGGNFGLMGLLAKTVLQNGGTVYGVLPQELVERGTALESATNLEVVENMSIRKRRMIELSDACIALPGGPGTLEEISEAFSWARIGDNNNPCVLYNVADYYRPLEKMYDEMTAKGFLTKADREKLLFSESLTKIGQFIDGYVPPKIREY
ncbi:LOG family protein [Fructilactobacillus sanfranciscensis]|uniref:LOG family protein n=1 Tax=Fructilactobacillus sanfranciscensis TaxID=1625 RepID=UPI0012EC709C|nr:TIGR00730 family Rossman fold protein [Fructilactobacillus sanfranciscensis]MVF15798.1 TIGR00730 family Rossman fold protein [Fructilactobacillus sanfranciscensis]